VRAADQATRAALHGQSLLAQLGVGERLQPGRSEGEFEGGRYRWQLQVAPYVDPIAGAVPLRDVSAPELLQVRLEMRWGQGPREHIVWDSLRLVPSDPNRGRNLP
jgi:general secretion pathway protein I